MLLERLEPEICRRTHTIHTPRSAGSLDRVIMSANFLILFCNFFWKKSYLELKLPKRCPRLGGKRLWQHDEFKTTCKPLLSSIPTKTLIRIYARTSTIKNLRLYVFLCVFVCHGTVLASAHVHCLATNLPSHSHRYKYLSCMWYIWYMNKALDHPNQIVTPCPV